MIGRSVRTATNGSLIHTLLSINSDETDGSAGPGPF